MMYIFDAWTGFHLEEKRALLLNFFAVYEKRMPANTTLFSRKKAIGSSPNEGLLDACFSRIKKRYTTRLMKLSIGQKNIYKTLCVAHATDEETEHKEQETFLDQIMRSL